MSMSVSVKKATNKTNINHNNRTMNDKEKEKNTHIDSERSHENKYLVQKDLRELYQDEFGQALENYNAKQKRKDRKIDDYFKHIQSSKKTSLQQEMIIQVGDKDDFSSKEDFDKANEILEEWFLEFEERNPNLKVYNAVIHNDEASPHMHLNFVPVASDYKRGLEKQVSFDRAITQQDSTLNKTRPFDDWREKEVQSLEALLKERGIERKLVGTNKYKDVNEYKEKKDLEQEIALLQDEVLVHKAELINLEMESENVQTDLKNIEQNIKYKKNELLSYTEQVPNKLDINPKKQMKNVEVPTGEKNFWGIEKMTTEKRPTGKIILPENEFKELMNFAQHTSKLKKQLEKVLSTDLADEVRTVSERYQTVKNENQQLKDENSKLKRKNNELHSEVDSLKVIMRTLQQDMELVYRSTKEFFKDHTESLKGFRVVFDNFVDRIKKKTKEFEKNEGYTSHTMNKFEEIHKKETKRERDFDLEI